MTTPELFPGRHHTYLARFEIGGLLHGEDETGRKVALLVGPRVVLLERLQISRLMPPGVLPDVIEYREMEDEGMGFLVMEAIHGYPLWDLVVEGRWLTLSECRLLVSDLAADLAGFIRLSLEPEVLRPKDVVYDAGRKRPRFRLAGVPRTRQGEGESTVARGLARLALDVSGEDVKATRLGRLLRKTAQRGGSLSRLQREGAGPPGRPRVSRAE